MIRVTVRISQSMTRWTLSKKSWPAITPGAEMALIKAPRRVGGIVSRLPRTSYHGYCNKSSFRHYEPIIQQASIFCHLYYIDYRYCWNIGRNHLPLRFRKIGLHEEESVFLKVQEWANWSRHLIDPGNGIRLWSLWYVASFLVALLALRCLLRFS